MKNKLSPLFAAAILLWSCDKIDDPIPKGLGNSLNLNSAIEFVTDPSLNINDTNDLKNFLANSNWTDTATSPSNTSKRFIVVEEFTGHTCINCIPGTKEILRLDSIYGEQLIPVGIHAGTFALPRDPVKYKLDFRAKPPGFGETIFELFNPEGANPRAVVNRLTTAAGNAKSIAEWSKDIKDFENEPPIASLSITNYFDAAQSVIRSNIEIEWLVSNSETYKLQLYVLEDHIVGYQKDSQDPRIDIPDYDHRHVLRKFVNGTFGKELLPAIVNEKETIEYIYPFTEGMVENNNNNIKVVAFIFNNDPNSYEVMQANAAYIVKK